MRSWSRFSAGQHGLMIRIPLQEGLTRGANPSRPHNEGPNGCREKKHLQNVQADSQACELALHLHRHLLLHKKRHEGDGSRPCGQVAQISAHYLTIMGRNMCVYLTSTSCASFSAGHIMIFDRRDSRLRLIILSETTLSCKEGGGGGFKCLLDNHQCPPQPDNNSWRRPCSLLKRLYARQE